MKLLPMKPHPPVTRTTRMKILSRDQTMEHPLRRISGIRRGSQEIEGEVIPNNKRLHTDLDSVALGRTYGEKTVSRLFADQGPSHSVESIESGLRSGWRIAGQA